MSHLLAQVSLATKSGLPEDRVVNTFHFRGLGDFHTPEVIQPTLEKVADFYRRTAPGNNVPLMSLLSQGFVSNHEVKLYDQGLPMPRAPIGRLDFVANPPTSGIAVPAELALCLSFRGRTLSGTLPRRRRGRVYTGPWSTTGVEDQGMARPTSQQIAILLNVGKQLLAANVDDPVTPATRSVWVVAGLDGLVDVTDLWVDNEWDTQRRRGRKATARVTFP